MEKKAKNTLYNVIVFLILFLPTSTYLFLSATIYNIEVDYTVKTLKTDIISVVYDDSIFIYSDDENVLYQGKVIYNKELDKYGFNVKDGEIVKHNNKYLAIEFNLSTKNMEIASIKKFEVKQKSGVKIPLAVIISIAGAVIAGLVILKKMKALRRKRRLATLISLTIGTAILFGMNEVVSNLLTVFVIFTGSWLAYCIAYLIKHGNVASSNADKLEELLYNLK